MDKPRPGASYLSGFIEGKRCFIAGISADSTCKSGYRLKLTFQIGLQKKDKVLLELIKEFFGVGQITELNFKSFQYCVYWLEGWTSNYWTFGKVSLINWKVCGLPTI